MTVKMKVLLLMLGIGSSIVISSCSKDPDNGGCGDENCDKIGWVENMPGWCATPPSGEKVIRGEDGVYYRVTRDKTGQWASMQIGQKVRFGVKNVKDGEGDDVRVQPAGGFAPVIIKEATLSCLEAIEEGGNKNCNVDAEVVELSYQPNGPGSGENVLRIGNQHYVVIGEYAEQVAAMAPGTHVKVGYTADTHCFITQVVTYPDRNGCIQLSCLSEDEVVILPY